MKTNMNAFLKLGLAFTTLLQSVAMAASSGARLTTNTPIPNVTAATNVGNLAGFRQYTRQYLGNPPISPVDHVRNNLQVSPLYTDNGSQAQSELYITIAVGTEEVDWFRAAFDELVKKGKNKLPNGRVFYVNLEGKGSISAANAIVESARSKNPSNRYTAWAPAASVYKSLVTDHFATSPFASEDTLVNSPVVFVTYEDQQKAIDNRYSGMSLMTVGQIFADELKAHEGVIKSNKKPFKFGTTDPAQSSTGAIMLMMAAYEFFSDRTGGHKPDVNVLRSDDFQGFLALIKGNAIQNVDSTERLASTLSSSIPTIDSGFMYESSAINAIRNLQQRGKRHVSVRYPKFNFITDHPFYILANGTTMDEQRAARIFLDHLLSDEMQKLAATQFNFRPIKPVIDEDTQDDLFKKYQAYGIIPTEDIGNLEFMDPPDRSFIEAVADIYKGVSFQDPNN